MGNYCLLFAHQKALKTFEGTLRKHPFFVPYLGLHRNDQVLTLMVVEGEKVLCTLIVLFYFDKNRTFCMRMERFDPACSLSKREEYSVLEFLLKELRELCDTSGAKHLEVEVLHGFKSQVFFPSSEFLFDSLNTSLLENVEMFGFRKHLARTSYVVPFPFCQGNSSCIRTMKNNLYEERLHYYSLLSCSQYVSDYFNPSIKAHFWLSDYSHWFDIENVYFYETERIRGLSHWMPNLYGTIRERRDLYAEKRKVNYILGKLGEAKIFRIVGDTLNIRTELLDFTLEELRARGCRTVQVGNVTQDDPLVDILLDRGAKAAFKTALYYCFERDNDEK